MTPQNSSVSSKISSAASNAFSVHESSSSSSSSEVSSSEASPLSSQNSSSSAVTHKSSSSSSSAASLSSSSSSGSANITTGQTRQVYPLLKTGQTVSYVNFDDGWYQIGADRSYTRSSEIVTDNVTGLMWQDNYERSPTRTWADAISYCENSTLGGYSDWRLPEIEALLTLPDYGRSPPAIDPLFERTIRPYWSSTSGASGPYDAWYVDFNGGFDGWNTKTDTLYVRCVRGGQFEHLTAITRQRSLRRSRPDGSGRTVRRHHQ